jgi:hypothetical protein
MRNLGRFSHLVATGVALVALCAPAKLLADTTPAPTYSISSGSTTTGTKTPTASGTPVLSGAAGKAYAVPSQTVTNTTSGGSTSSVTIGSTGNTDPFINYYNVNGVGLAHFENDTSSAMNFVFDFKIPIVPINGEGDVHTSLSGFLNPTDGNTGGVSIDPFNQKFVQEVFLWQTDAQKWIEVGGAGLGSSSTTQGAYPPTDTTSFVDPPGPFSGLEITVGLTLSAFTELDLQGSVTAGPSTPVPATIVQCLGLAATGCCFAMGRRWYRRRPYGKAKTSV